MHAPPIDWVHVAQRGRVEVRLVADKRVEFGMKTTRRRAHLRE